MITFWNQKSRNSRTPCIRIRPFWKKCPREFIVLPLKWDLLVLATLQSISCHYWIILRTIQAIVPWNTMPATLNKSIFKTRSHVLFGLGTISHSRSLLQYLFLLYYESLEEAGCRIIAEKLLSNENPKNYIFIYIKTFASN